MTAVGHLFTDATEQMVAFCITGWHPLKLKPLLFDFHKTLLIVIWTVNTLVLILGQIQDFSTMKAADLYIYGSD